MKKSLFYTGLVLQLVHLSLITALFMPKISQEYLLGIGYVVFNILTLGMIFAGLFLEDKK